MADSTTATPEVRPLVRHLTLGPTRDKDYLNGSRCKNCGELYIGPRLFCAKCSWAGDFDPVRLSDTGQVYVWTIVYQATPYVKAPYIAAIVDLDGGGSVNANIVGVEPRPDAMKFGMKVKMSTEKVSEDEEGNSYIAYQFRPA